MLNRLIEIDISSLVTPQDRIVAKETHHTVASYSPPTWWRTLSSFSQTSRILVVAWAQAKRRCGVAFEGLETTVSMSEVRMRRHSDSSLIIVVGVSLLLAHTPKAGAIPLPEPEPVVVERVSVGFDGEQGTSPGFKGRVLPTGYNNRCPKP